MFSEYERISIDYGKAKEVLTLIRLAERTLREAAKIARQMDCDETAAITGHAQALYGVDELFRQSVMRHRDALVKAAKRGAK